MKKEQVLFWLLLFQKPLHHSSNFYNVFMFKSRLLQQERKQERRLLFGAQFFLFFFSPSMHHTIKFNDMRACLYHLM